MIFFLSWCDDVFDDDAREMFFISPRLMMENIIHDGDDDGANEDAERYFYGSAERLVLPYQSPDAELKSNQFNRLE